MNLPEGKNLIGAFHQPIAVVADVDTLRSLPEREYRAGLGEVAKYALIAQLSREHVGLAEIVEAGAEAIRGRDADALTELVFGCVELKADFVARDPEERTGVREKVCKPFRERFERDAHPLLGGENTRLGGNLDVVHLPPIDLKSR